MLDQCEQIAFHEKKQVHNSVCEWALLVSDIIIKQLYTKWENYKIGPESY